MKKIATIILLFVTLFSFSQNQELGQSFIEVLLSEKNMEKAHAYLDVSIQNKVTIDLLTKTNEQLEKQLGSYKQVISVSQKENGFIYYTQFKNIALDFEITFSSDKIIGFFLKPHKEITTNDYVVKSGSIDLRGTLLEAKNSNILIVFVHGSGANDRDETLGPNKPFKDMAETFQKAGISSYRYDKRTFTHPETFTDKSTVYDEVIFDVLSVVTHFRNSETFKNHKIIVLGHSLGAYLLPKIANLIPLDKAIMMAGNARGLQDVVIDQYTYLNQIQPTAQGVLEKEKIKKQVAFLKSNDFTSASSSDLLPFGMSATYWKYLLAYQPLVEVKSVSIPLLILNGERDYQVTMKEFNLWKKTIKSSKVSFISYPKLNHLFLAGDGQPNPKEYNEKGVVDEKVIQDIITFCKQ